MDSPARRFFSLIVAASLFLPTRLPAAFFELPEIYTGLFDLHGLAFDGTNWHIANNSTGYRNFDASFNLLSTTTVSGMVQSLGVTYDPNSNHLFTADASAGVVREVTLDGTFVSSFIGGGGIQALAYDPRDDTLWMAFFNGVIEHRTRDGLGIGPVGFFNTGKFFNGLAIDTVNNTLLALSSDDLLWEYKFDGTLLGNPIATDEITDNGLQLSYDSTAGRLYVTSQEGYISTFSDPARVPEPTSAGLLLLGALTLLHRRRRP